MKFNFTLLSNLLSATKKRSSLCSRQPKEVISDASIATAASISSTSIRTAVEPNINEWCSNCIEIFPLPLIIDKTLSGTMYIQNTRSCYWMAVRVIVYSVCMKVFPQKFLVPPARKAAVSLCHFFFQDISTHAAEQHTTNRIHSIRRHFRLNLPQSNVQLSIACQIKYLHYFLTCLQIYLSLLSS
uniref:Secreted protein n=2 Tax=Parascaris univalens TaxID=6257 RepID=A0A914ZPP5_PARUN